MPERPGGSDPNGDPRPGDPAAGVPGRPMSSARLALEARLARGGRGLIPFLTAGYPDWDVLDAAISTLAEAGADVLELGIPFSDPLADGPSIQASSQKALDAGVTVEQILGRVERRGASWGLPIVLMTYANPILAYGAERFAARAQDAGVAGVLVSDLPPEELPEVWEAIRGRGLETVMLVAPTTDRERIPVLVEAAGGYVYCLTRTGVTGQGGAFAADFAERIGVVRSCTTLPVVAGFGIRAPEDVAALGSVVDGVVVGARLVEILGGDRKKALEDLRALAVGLRRALDRR